jgi:hypothetical protein
MVAVSLRVCNDFTASGGITGIDRGFLRLSEGAGDLSEWQHSGARLVRPVEGDDRALVEFRFAILKAVSRLLCKHPRRLMFRVGYTGCTRAEDRALRRRNLSADSAAGIRRVRAQLDPASS